MDDIGEVLDFSQTLWWNRYNPLKYEHSYAQFALYVLNRWVNHSSNKYDLLVNGSMGQPVQPV